MLGQKMVRGMHVRGGTKVVKGCLRDKWQGLRLTGSGEEVLKAIERGC